MPTVRDHGVVLRVWPYSETSQLVTLFTRRHGLQRLLAKGARRADKAGFSRFDHGLDQLDRGVAMFNHDPRKELPLILEWKLLDGHRSLRRSLRSLALAQLVGESTLLTHEVDDASSNLFDRLAVTLGELSRPGREAACVCYLLDLLEHAGLAPVLTACILCGKRLEPTDRPGFDPQLGGMVCVGCLKRSGDAFAVDPTLPGMFRTLTDLPRDGGRVERPPKLSPAQGNALLRPLLLHLQTQLQRPVCSGSFILGGDRL